MSADYLNDHWSVLTYLEEQQWTAAVENDITHLQCPPTDETSSLIWSWSQVVATMAAVAPYTYEIPTLDQAKQALGHAWDLYVAVNNDFVEDGEFEIRGLFTPPEDPELAEAWKRYWHWIKRAVQLDVPILFPLPLF